MLGLFAMLAFGVAAAASAPDGEPLYAEPLTVRLAPRASRTQSTSARGVNGFDKNAERLWPAKRVVTSDSE